MPTTRREHPTREQAEAIARTLMAGHDEANR